MIDNMMQQIATAIVNRTCVLFAGSGTSRDAGLPDWVGLGRQLRDELVTQSKLGPPFSDTVSTLLAEGKTVPAAIELMLVTVERKDLVQVLRGVLAPRKPSDVCEHLRKLGLRGVVTTNYDRVVNQIVPEQAYNLSNSLDHLKIVPTAVTYSGKFLLKLHGDVDNELGPSDPLVADGAALMVLCTSDYNAFLQGQRREHIIFALHSILQQNSVLFLGYSFSDPDINWVLKFLGDYCQFRHTSWYVGLKHERFPTLPANVVGVPAIDGWEELPSWLSRIATAVRALESAEKRTAKAKPPEPHILSVEEQAAFQELARYLRDLESDDIADRVLASALLQEISGRAEVSLEWLSEKVSKLLEVGPALAKALAMAAVSYMTGLGLTEAMPNGNLRVATSRVETLKKRAEAEWTRDKDRFDRSIRGRFSRDPDMASTSFLDKLDPVLQELCVNLGESMARWIHRGLGEELRWARVEGVVSRHLADREDIRRAKRVLESIFSQPSDDEVPYLYRLLATAFLANSVRLHPQASKVIASTLASYELFPDTNVLLPLVIDEHPNHGWVAGMVKTSREVGVELYVLDNMFDELCAHRDLADRSVVELGEDFSKLSRLVEVLGNRSNCFIHGYVNACRSSARNGWGANGAAAQPTGVTWRVYIGRYGDGHLKEWLEQAGVKYLTYDADVVCDTDYPAILAAIRQEWQRRGHFDRAAILNENEARVFCYIYKRRAELRDEGKPPEAWFLSYETVLAKVFEGSASKWGMPPTFPVSAWVAFLDSRVPWAHKDPRVVVNAILKGNSSAFDLPDPIDIVRRRAFGDSVPTQVEEEALQLAFSGHALVTRIDGARKAIFSRAERRSGIPEFDTTIQTAVAEIDSELSKDNSKLREQLAKTKAEKEALEAKLREREQQFDHKRKQPSKPAPAMRRPPSRRRK